MKKKLFLLIFAVLAVFFLSILALLRPAGDKSEIQAFRVNQGEGFRQIAARLEHQQIIRSRIGITLYGFFSGTGRTLKPGLYELSPGDSGRKIAQIISSGPTDINITIREGETVVDVDKRLAELGLVGKGEFLNLAISLEGFIFPDTYRLSPDYGAGEVLATFLKNFKTKTSELMPGLSFWAGNMINCLEKEKYYQDYDLLSVCGVDLPGGEEYNKLIIASILEKEIPESEDRKKVAGVIYSRIDVGMAIQVDATIVYAVCGKTFYDCRPLARSDFGIDSLFNTYKHPGFPPTPISNPGLDAIKASIEPEDSEYVYYLSDPESGQTVFSSTLEEHNENRSQYLGL
jgi:UPF0755 protein